MVFDGYIEFVEGTSCATPVSYLFLPSLCAMLSILEHPADRHTQVAASIISLLNDFLLYKDRSPLGFLNPFLYGVGQDGLNDITQGSNPACKTDGFSAIAGWDPVRSFRPDFVSSPLFFQFLADSGLLNRSQASGPPTFSNCRKRLLIYTVSLSTPRLLETYY